ncbi:MAG TPA: 16S rRNA (cytosine(1402)-N(4))-methyltransferase RsmH [Gammaproteobacteria bacterium]
MAQEIGSHLPVMVTEVLTALQPRDNGIFIDCTYGRGGHSRALLSRLGPEGKVIAMDRDPAAVSAGRDFAQSDERLLVVREKFSNLHSVAREREVLGKVSGVLFDLGVSSPQLDDPRRGFSFQSEGPLDMRMDADSGYSAAEWLARADAGEIADILWRYGEERYSRRIARAICSARQVRAINTTAELAAIVESTIPRPKRRHSGRGHVSKHPATRTFQAIRIFINDEIRELSTALGHAIDVLEIGGRLGAISFHSLEDRTVKRFMRDQVRGAPHASRDASRENASLRVIGRPQRPGDEEIQVNPRARSAVLRVAEKLS